MSDTVPVIHEDPRPPGNGPIKNKSGDPLIYVEIGQTLERLKQLLQVEFLTVLIPSSDGDTLYPVVTTGFDSDLARSFSLPLHEAALNQLRGDLAPVVVENPTENLAQSPLCRIPGVVTLVVVPLVVEGRLRGVLHLGSRSEPPAKLSDVDLLGFAAHTLALAVDRADLRRAEARARQASITTRDQLTFLAIASGILASSLDYETTLSQITGMLVPRLADVCAVVLLDDDGTINQVTVEGNDPRITELVRELQSRYSLLPGSHSAVRRSLDSGKTVFYDTLDDDYFLQTGSNAEHVELLREIGMRSMVIVPLNGRGATIGALSLAYLGTDRRYTDEDVSFLEDLAHRAAMAVENARLFTESQRALQDREEALRFREETLHLERAARARAEAAQRREAFLSEASNVLSSSFDSSATLSNLARLVVERAADWFTIELFDENGVSSMAVAAHIDPASDSLMRQLREEYIPVTIPELPPRHVLRYREPVLINHLPDDFWFDSTTSPQQLLMLEQLDTRALVIVPLFVRKRPLGVMTLARSGEDGQFDEEDLPMAIDLGYRVALSLENSQLYQNAQRVLQQQEEFISTASHELKTPLTTVKGYLQLINRQLHREDHSPARLVRFTQELDVQVQRLEDLVSDLLDVSRIQQGRLELRLEPFDMSELAAEVMSRFEYAPERLPIHELTLSTSGSCQGMWDRGRIDQVLTNLISNALKYSPNGGQILVHVRRIDDFVQIKVRDHGIGISADERTRVFQPFSRGKNAKQNISGTGLGLYITLRIVQNHHGDIFVKSDPGHGTTFIVQLPLITSSETA